MSEVFSYWQDAIAQRDKRIRNLEHEAALLTIKLTSLTETYIIAEAKIRDLEADLEQRKAIVTDAFKIFDKYLNVPEAHELRDRWAKLNEL